ncbi:MAG: hypothetical protein KPI85_01905 [cyanobacterium endosymbiont of Epithemia adnata isolate EadnSB Bon19]
MSKSVAQALLEIHTAIMASAIFSDTILYERLSINKENDEEIDKQHIAVCTSTQLLIKLR